MMLPPHQTALAAILAAAVALPACDGDGKGRGPVGSSGSAATASPSGSGAAATATFAAAVNEKPIFIRSILAHSRGGRALQMTLSTHELGCKDLRQRGTLLEPDEVVFNMTLAERLAPDGKQAWAITRARLGMTSRQGNLGEATVTADDPNKTVRAKVKLALVNPPSRAGKKAPRSLQLAGDLTAEGCGLMTAFKTEDARFQEHLRVDVAGARIAIHGATLTPSSKGLVLRLSSEPHTCSTGPEGSDVAIALTLNEEREAVAEAQLSGYVLPRPLRAAVGDDGIAARLSTDSDHGDSTTVELNGKAKIGSYVLELNGTARPKRCSP